ncbi:MAG: polyphosphate kinase 1, partial [Oscillospiraceae bacterium]|nr:polyphosphate kinase 1 [Oscillospiraceae bacterium]
SRRLQDSGCNIIYGPRDLKVHSKLLLIKRTIGKKTEYITQIGTGNYNEKTSTLYTDLSLMTANPEIGADAEKLFDALLNNRLVEESEHLLIAPLALRDPILKMIDEEIEYARNGETAYVGIKINSLCDKTIIDKLIEASQAGVKIDMVIRGICSLVSGIEGFTENITVISIVGRYLEHSRIYIFGTEERRKIYISSADYMTRNTIRRVEVAAPVYNEKIKKRLWNMFEILLSDNVKARIQLPDGTYIYKTNDKPPIDAQRFFSEEAYKKAERKAAAKEKAKARSSRKTKNRNSRKNTNTEKS